MLQSMIRWVLPFQRNLNEDYTSPPKQRRGQRLYAQNEEKMRNQTGYTRSRSNDTRSTDLPDQAGGRRRQNRKLAGRLSSAAVKRLISLERGKEAAVQRSSSEDHVRTDDWLVTSTEIHSYLISDKAGRDLRAYEVATRRGTCG